MRRQDGTISWGYGGGATWEYGEGAWWPVTTTNVPVLDTGHGLVYDGRRVVVVLAGLRNL